MQDLPQALESAAKTLIDAESLTLTVFTGQSAETMVLPAALCHCSGGDEFPQDSGNYDLQLDVMVMSNADDSTLSQHRSLCNSVLAVFNDANTASNLSSQASDFHVIGVKSRSASSTNREDDHWVTTMHFNAYCCLTDLV